VCLFVYLLCGKHEDGISWPLGEQSPGGERARPPVQSFFVLGQMNRTEPNRGGVTVTSNTSAVINIPVMEFSGARDERVWEAYMAVCAHGVAAAAAAAAAQFEQDSPDQSDLHSLSGASSTDTDDGRSASPHDDTVMSFQGDPFDDDSTPLSRSPEDYDRHNTGAVVADLAQLACQRREAERARIDPLSSQDH
jgi:hypothetical protein